MDSQWFDKLGGLEHRYLTYVLSKGAPTAEPENLVSQQTMIAKTLRRKMDTLRESYIQPSTPVTTPINSTENLAISTAFMKANRLSNDYHDFLRGLHEHFNNRYRYEKQHKEDDKISSKLKEIYNIALHDEKKLRDFLSMLWNTQNPLVHHIWSNIPKGQCHLCRDTPRQIYCEDCERRLQSRSRKIAVLRIHGLKLLQENNEKVKMMIDKKLALRSSFAKKQVDIKEKERLLAYLIQKRDELRGQLIEGREQVSIKCLQNTQHRIELKNSRETLKASSAENYIKQEKLEESKRVLAETIHKLEACRRQRISDLITLLPLKVSSRESMIFFINSHYSNLVDFSSVGNESGAATLGYVVLLVSIMSQYLNVHLPYDMQFMGSSSVIRKQGYRESTVYPLSSKLGGPQEFKMALHQLGANIYYLCVSQGMVFEDKEDVQQHFLLNLLHLIYNCKSLGSVNPQPTVIPSYAGRFRHSAVVRESYESVTEERGEDEELDEWEVVDDRTERKKKKQDNMLGFP
eukprot:TRINITY_DN2343_c0_g1_i1.p1 TRINITY_DN2343_c0_g1~~TRINITY_DN2343_c0_g1_i1.p1  ORF type:complete len:576 (-),score=86.96 TRINITY_DN2343_c0_g1_i1:661-2214(-)